MIMGLKVSILLLLHRNLWTAETHKKKMVWGDIEIITGINAKMLDGYLIDLRSSDITSSAFSMQSVCSMFERCDVRF